MRERIASHASDPRPGHIYEILAVTGARMMNEAIRLYLQRRIVEGFLYDGMIGCSDGFDAERRTASN
jgi:hypothetical protein